MDIDEIIFPVRSNLDSVKNKLKNVTGKLYGKYLKCFFVTRQGFVFQFNMIKVLLKVINNVFILHLGVNQELEREKRKEDGTNQLLQRKYPELWKVTNWLRNCDKSMFKGQVFEPLFTQVIYGGLDQTQYFVI